MYHYFKLIFLSISLIFTTNLIAETKPEFVDAAGKISLPEDFRLNMVHLGSWYVPSGGASGFHDVYTQAESAKAYRETGKFPDGATLVKELRASKAGNYTTGAGVHSATETVKQTFVMVKDSANSYPNNTNWGDGWGWALFKGDNAVNLSKNYKQDCLGCHVPVKASDWVYVQGYPTLFDN